MLLLQDSHSTESIFCAYRSGFCNPMAAVVHVSEAAIFFLQSAHIRVWNSGSVIVSSSFSFSLFVPPSSRRGKSFPIIVLGRESTLDVYKEVCL